VWFAKQTPPAVDAVVEKVAGQIGKMYDTRRTALTMMECFRMVDDTRREWQQELPVSILKALRINNQVFASKSEARESSGGQECEAVHYLVYMVHKVYNRAAQVLATLKKRESFATLNDMKHQKSATAPIDETMPMGVITTGRTPLTAVITKVKWHDNPPISVALTTARNSVHCATFSDQEALERALTLTVAKLTTAPKPKLAECLQCLASIMALVELAGAKEWIIDGRLETAHFL
jgi:hypothetical protein